MAQTPRQTLDDDFIDGLNCTICGQDTLKITHIERLPDYVSCGNCGSAFVVEADGDRVMYGKIHDDYPTTKQFAERQWAWMEAIQKRAETERPEPEFPEQPPISDAVPIAGIPIPTEPESEPAPDRPIPLTLEPDARPFAETVPPPPVAEVEEEFDESIDTPKFPPKSEIQEMPVHEPVTPAEAIPEPDVEEEVEIPKPPLVLKETDPPPGQRYRVVIKGTNVQFPKKVCAHCLRTPARNRLSVIGSLPEGQGVGQRRAAPFNLPLCADCRQRATQRNEEEKSARLQAVMISTLIAMVLLVVGLAMGINPLEQPMTNIPILGIIAILGYTIPVMILLNRIPSYDPPPEAAYIRSTLLIPSDIQGLETAFEFRNQGYAERFHEENSEVILGRMTPVKDRSLPFDSTP